MSRAGRGAARLSVVVLALGIFTAGRCAAQDDSAVRRLVVFGDNVNDLPMFEVADERYAVANATELLREAVRWNDSKNSG